MLFIFKNMYIICRDNIEFLCDFIFISIFVFEKLEY